jgi:hypothetical protein
MSVAIKIVGNALGFPTPHDGRYVQEVAWDIDEDGRCEVTSTTDLSEAKHFPDFPSATEFWKTQSKCNPLRPDGKPNRALTAYSVEIAQHPAGWSMIEYGQKM